MLRASRFLGLLLASGLGVIRETTQWPSGFGRLRNVRFRRHPQLEQTARLPILRICEANGAREHVRR